MKVKTPARNRAIGAIGPGDVAALERAGISLIYTLDLESLHCRIKELESRLRLAETPRDAASVPRGAMVQ